ncbi:lipoprotein bor [Moraxella caviae]|nr:lipoprotein bor [Moraxella caviae]
MKKLALAGTFAIALASLTGCATQTYLLSPNSAHQETPTYDKGQTFFVAGLGQEQEVNAAEICGSTAQIAKVETKLTPMNALLGYVSSGIYTPRQMKVYCK